eukprot:Colp12_sorted_trinity150504_noHs@18052
MVRRDYRLTVRFTEAQVCLKDKWIMMVGDSSLRILFSALSELINGTLEVPFFPRNRLTPGLKPNHDTQKGLTDVEREINLENVGFLREFRHKDANIRITFVFKTYSEVEPPLMQALLTGGTKPDLLVLQTGAWDQYRKHSDIKSMYEETIPTVEQWLSNITALNLYNGPLMWIGMTECENHINGKFEWISLFNQMMWGVARKYKVQGVMPRGTHTRSRPKPDMFDLCEGFHAWNHLAFDHATWLLGTLCT